MGKHVAIMGTGIMGTGMGKVLLKQGYSVSCYNRTESNAKDLVAAGATYAKTPAKAAEAADFVIIMMWNKEALDSVVLGDDGLFANAKDGQVFIDMSTQLPDTGLWLAKEFAKKGAGFLDAPVHGSKGEANSGGLWIMAGGDENTYRKALPILQIVGETVHYMGGSGKGYATKLCGNHLVSTIVAALCESMVLAKKAGLDPKEVLSVWMDSDFRSPVVEGVGNSIISRNFEVAFHLRTMVKDTELIRNYSESLNVPVLLSNIVHEINKVGLNKGYGEENASAVVKVFEEMAGIL
ncbi:MAG: NAD(P)-dependent oxidoreductase [Sphaerochaetaceae bacterium]|jgi:3-hydroxyisobutyrate dehydrogenase-like beta-hydroxyacid dehydrogenase|nr:NAD(P)-dependent oxidoreductase [Sphaerochaetaceae bacterium]